MMSVLPECLIKLLRYDKSYSSMKHNNCVKATFNELVNAGWKSPEGVRPLCENSFDMGNRSEYDSFNEWLDKIVPETQQKEPDITPVIPVNSVGSGDTKEKEGVEKK